MNRKDFLLKTGAAMLAFSLPLKNNYAFGDEMDVTGDCVPTTTDILGPYYRANAPFRSDLLIPGETGALFNYKGKITDENCNPIAGATVDVWQAGSDAAYDNNSALFNYRGKFQTSANGEYEFRSVKPGWYLNGSQYRPAHIHFRVTRTGFTELITQLYFQGDPYIADDPWASAPEAQMRLVPVTVNNGVQEATFNITLQSSVTGIKETRQVSPVTVAPNPFRDELHFASGIDLLSIEIFNNAGTLVARFYNIKETHLTIQLNYLGPGVYFCRVETGKGIFVHRAVKI